MEGKSASPRRCGFVNQGRYGENYLAKGTREARMNEARKYEARKYGTRHRGSLTTWVLACFCWNAGHAVADKPTVTTSAGEFWVGFAERDITPEIGMEAPGGYGKAYHRVFHDACKVRAVVFDDGQQRAALVGLDVLFIHDDTAAAVRREIQQATGIPADAVLLGASHSHSSGPASGVMPGEYDHASALVRTLARDHSTVADPRYLARFSAAIVDAVKTAHKNREPARAGVGRGFENQVAFNRRFRMKNGLTFTHPGQNNPDIIEPAGPADPEVGVIGVWNGRGQLTGCVVNFACHATTSPGGISANYIYYLEKVIRGYYKDAVVVFLNGMSGDITQVDNRNAHQNRGAERWAEFVGGRIGAEALKVLLTMEPGTLTPVVAKRQLLAIPRRKPHPDKVRRSLEIAKQDPRTTDHTAWAFAKEIVMVDAKIAKTPVAQVEVQAIQVGPVVLVSSPAEYFCQYGLDIKKGSGFPFTFPVSLANGCVGYVPTEDAFASTGGGYETRLTSYSNLEITAGNKIRDTGISLARQLKPGAVPMLPKAAPFTGNPWTYGNLAPERE